jgi:ATPase family associated with various cellular activities (AAA)
MDTSQFPPPAELNIHTQVDIRAGTFHEAMRRSLLSRAHAHADATFSIYREARMAVRRDRNRVIDHFASCRDWMTLRSGYHTLILRSTGLFGTIAASGPTENCAVVVELWADTPERGDATLERILAEIRPYRITDIGFCLNWRFLDGKGEVKRASTEERASEPLLNEAYPVLVGVNEFIDQYLDAPETVLVLQGSPGTGKTRLIRAILAAISRRKAATAEVLYTGDSAVLENDEVFLEFITESHSAFVVEDADHLLKPRAGGNPTLHRFLNIADGIACAHGKKIIFSTNLPNIHDIDEALVRPGRCFAHLYMEELQAFEAARLLDRLCEQNPERHAAARARLDLQGKKAFSVAEVYSAFRNTGSQPTRPASPRYGVTRNPDRVAFGFN